MNSQRCFLNQKIKIVQIIKGLDIGGDSGGAELFGIKLARALNQQDICDVWICAYYSVHTEAETKWLETLNKEGIRTFFVSEWGGYNNLLKFFQGFFRLLSIIKKEKVDVIHSHFQLGTLAAVLLKMLGFTRSALRTCHISKEWDKGRWTWLLFPIFIKRLFPTVLDAEVGVSQALCNYLTNLPGKKVDKRKVHLIYNGVELIEIKKQSQIPLINEDQSFFSQKLIFIGCVGRLAEQKGYPYIFEAMSEVIKLFPNCVLVVVGDGELRDNLIQLRKELHLIDNIKFLGLRDNVPALLTNMDIFVLPSLWEGLPTVVIEAMACRVPVIATDIPGTRELVQNGVNGILVPDRDPVAIKNAIVELIDAPHKRKLFVEEAERTIWQYDIQSIADNYLKLYKKILRY